MEGQIQQIGDIFGYNSKTTYLPYLDETWLDYVKLNFIWGLLYEKVAKMPYIPTNSIFSVGAIQNINLMKEGYILTNEAI